LTRIRFREREDRQVLDTSAGKLLDGTLNGDGIAGRRAWAWSAFKRRQRPLGAKKKRQTATAEAVAASYDGLGMIGQAMVLSDQS
jgi:hypothetical protein